jgi:alkylhydroperoxidase family enzyme
LARQLGYTEEEIGALEDQGRRTAFAPEVRLALEYAELMTRDAHRVTDEFFGRLKSHYTDSQILELTSVVGLTNYWNRFTTALRIDLSGTDEPYDNPAGQSGPGGSDQ